MSDELDYDTTVAALREAELYLTRDDNAWRHDMTAKDFAAAPVPDHAELKARLWDALVEAAPPRLTVVPSGTNNTVTIAWQAGKTTPRQHQLYRLMDMESLAFSFVTLRAIGRRLIEEVKQPEQSGLYRALSYARQGLQNVQNVPSE